MKTRKPAHRLLFTLTALALALFVTGCGSCKPGQSPGKPLAYNLKISLGDSLKDSSLSVDVVGINPSDLQRWQTYSLKKYLKAGDPLRQDALKTTANFVPGQQAPFVLKKTDPMWDKWLKSGVGVQDLIIIADLPGVYEEGKIGSQDPRRQRIPLCECYWPSKTENLEIKVQAGGVTILTLPREGYPRPVF